MAEPKSRLELLTSTVQVVSVVLGVVFSVVSFNDTRKKDAEARVVEAEARAIEADKAFVELRRKTYLETVQTAAIITNPDNRSQDDLAKARRRFRELYVAELTMVEDPGVAGKMVDLANAVDPGLPNLTKQQHAALQLARALQAGYASPRVKVETGTP